ncbi:hypothetical protein, partial [Pseudomonas sp. HMSC75E02]|uniref:hypothetical protein n=2 Tax=unclassified Pseudomonas TaxID=196821 RepID=UPI001C47A014
MREDLGLRGKVLTEVIAANVHWHLQVTEKRAERPFFRSSENYWKPPRPALPSAEPRTEKTAGLPRAVFSIGGLAHAQAAAGRATRAESIGS